MEPIKMQETLTNVEAPRIENGKLLLIAGMGERYSCETSAGIPAQWQRFVPHLDHFPGHLSHVAYGVSCNSDGQGNFDYICGVEVGDFSKLSPEWSRIRIAPQRYAVFTHRGHISGIRGTWATTWNKALPESGYKLADAPDFERYDEHFDPKTGMGGVEIWIPIQSGA
jgi:AraC family transcriptional regulator